MEDFLTFKQAGCKKNKNKKKEAHFAQLKSLLKELSIRRIMPLLEAFHCHCLRIRQIECLSYEEKNLIRQRFKEKLRIDGLSVIIIICRETVMQQVLSC